MSEGERAVEDSKPARGAGRAALTAAPAVSVLMTAYNREPFIAAAIESVLAQTLSDFELIVVDDRSTDGTVDVVKRYLDDPRVRLVVNDHNLGDYPNRNHAAAFARGEFIKYHDSDDVMYPHCLQVLTQAIGAVPDAAVALTSSRGWTGGPCPMRLTPRLAYEREFLGSGLFHEGPAAALFRAAAFRELGGFPMFGAGSDYVFWLRACTRLNVVLAAGDLLWYRVHGGQEIASPRAEREYAIASREAWRALDSASCPLAGDDLVRARRNWAWTAARGAMRRLRARRISDAWDVIAFSGLSLLDWLRYLRRPNRSLSAGTPLGDEYRTVGS